MALVGQGFITQVAGQTSSLADELPDASQSTMLLQKKKEMAAVQLQAAALGVQLGLLFALQGLLLCFGDGRLGLGSCLFFRVALISTTFFLVNTFKQQTVPLLFPHAVSKEEEKVAK